MTAPPPTSCRRCAGPLLAGWRACPDCGTPVGGQSPPPAGRVTVPSREGDVPREVAQPFGDLPDPVPSTAPSAEAGRTGHAGRAGRTGQAGHAGRVVAATLGAGAVLQAGTWAFPQAFPQQLRASTLSGHAVEVVLALVLAGLVWWPDVARVTAPATALVAVSEFVDTLGLFAARKPGAGPGFSLLLAASVLFLVGALGVLVSVGRPTRRHLGRATPAAIGWATGGAALTLAWAVSFTLPWFSVSYTDFSGPPIPVPESDGHGRFASGLDDATLVHQGVTALLVLAMLAWSAMVTDRWVAGSSLAIAGLLLLAPAVWWAYLNAFGAITIGLYIIYSPRPGGALALVAALGLVAVGTGRALLSAQNRK